MYGKLFASLYQGTMRGRAHEILVFTNMIAHANQYGIVDKHFRAISEEVGLTIDEVKQAVVGLESPDPESRSPDEEGRKILRLDEHRVWGWKIVNYGKYRGIRSEEDRREQNRQAQDRWREKHKQSKPRKPNKAQAEGEAEGEAEALQATTTPPLPDAGIPTLKEVTTYGEMHGVKPEVAEKFYSYTEGNQLWLNRHGRMINWKQKLVDWQVRERTASPQAPERVNGTPRPASSVYAMKQRLDATESLIRDIRNRGTDHPLGWEAASPEDSKELKRLRTLKKQLTAELSKGTA
jgi:hypothetical protein